MREIQRAGRRFAYRGMLVALSLATVALLAASGTGSAHGIRVIQFKGHGPKVLPRQVALAGRSLPVLRERNGAGRAGRTLEDSPPLSVFSPLSSG